MKPHQNIQKRISTYALVGIATLLVLFTMGLFTKAYWQRHQAVEMLEVQLLATTESQAKRILGTLLLPEERAALPMILDRIKSDEKLSNISVHQFGNTQGDIKSDCRMINKLSSVCSGAFDTEVRTQSILKHGGKTYGVIEKTKTLNNQSWLNLSDPQVWLLILTALMLGTIMILVLKFMQKELEQKSTKESLGEMARMVAHDLRSPLSLLKVVAADSDHPMTETEKKLARQAVKRLEQITESLLKQQSYTKILTTTKLSKMLERLMAEKRYQHGHLDFIFENKLNKKIQLSSDLNEIQRALSNLLDNAAEAIESVEGSVRLTLYSEGNEVYIDILDTGVGFTDIRKSPKKTGHGLGVLAARQSLNQLNYESISGAGTATRIRLA